jgi:hypothetical protein
MIEQKDATDSSQIILKLCRQILGEYYLPEIGDKLIRLVIQIIIYRLNAVIERINSQG